MKKNAKIIISSERQFEIDKPRYNAYQTGHGSFVNKKAYTRKKKYKDIGE